MFGDFGVFEDSKLEGVGEPLTVVSFFLFAVFERQERKTLQSEATTNRNNLPLWVWRSERRDWAHL